jgi:hypothetical protein
MQDTYAYGEGSLMKNIRASFLIAGIGLGSLGVYAQQPADQWHFPMSYDSVAAAPRNHKVLFEDPKVRLIEVTLWPGEREHMHGHPYPSVFAVDAVFPKMTDKQLDPDASRTTKIGGGAKAPAGRKFPTCLTMGPQAPHAAMVTGEFPQHFYRLEFKRIDGDQLAKNWRTWYPWMLEPLQPVKDLVPGPQLGAKFSSQWPYPLAYDSVKAAPNNHYLRYEDGHVRFIEVVIRPGEKENMHGHPYPSVFAFDGPPLVAAGPAARPAATATPRARDTPLDPNSPLNNPVGGSAQPPEGYQAPSCSTMDPQAPHQAENLSDTPLHFYRIEFKRVDGEQFETQWRQWYPAMAQQAPAQR